jgi:hypothetical protein
MFLMNSKENIVKLIFYGTGVIKSLFVCSQVLPILFLPKELNPHFMRAR